MKASLALILTLLLVACASTRVKQAKSFDTVAEFLTWADSQIEEKNESHLVSAQTTTNFSTDYALGQINKMKRRLGNRSLSEVFKGEQFPKEGNTFKLGGHDGKLPNIHIDFIKQNEDWFLQSISTCR